jgi:hypothetical protein
VTTVLSDRSQGFQRVVSLSPDEIPLLRRLTEDYRHFRKARARLNRAVQEMLSIIDRFETERIDLGKARVRAGPESIKRLLEKPRSSPSTGGDRPRRRQRPKESR